MTDDRFGLDALTTVQIAQMVNVDEKHIQIVLSYARHCNLETVANLFNISKAEASIIVRATTPVLFEWAKERNKFHEAMVNHPNNRCSYLSEDIIGSVDTVPIYVVAYEDGYQPKYEHYVIKFLVVTSHTGFILA